MASIEERIRRTRSILRNPNLKARIQRAQLKYERQFKPLTDAIERSARLTAEDYAITINFSAGKI